MNNGMSVASGIDVVHAKYNDLFQSRIILKCWNLDNLLRKSEQNAIFAQSDDDRRRVEIGPHQCDIRRSGVEVGGRY